MLQDGVYPGRERNRGGVEMCDANVPTSYRPIRSFCKMKSENVILASFVYNLNNTIPSILSEKRQFQWNMVCQTPIFV